MSSTSDERIGIPFTVAKIRSRSGRVTGGVATSTSCLISAAAQSRGEFFRHRLFPLLPNEANDLLLGRREITADGFAVPVVISTDLGSRGLDDLISNFYFDQA